MREVVKKNEYFPARLTVRVDSTGGEYLSVFCFEISIGIQSVIESMMMDHNNGRMMVTMMIGEGRGFSDLDSD